MIVCHVRKQFSLQMIFLVMTLAGLIMPAIVDRYLFQKSLESLTREVLALDMPRRPRSFAEDQAFKAIIKAHLQEGIATEETPPVADAHVSP